MAYDRHHPIGGRHLDLLFAHLSYTIYNAVRLGSQNKMKTLQQDQFFMNWFEGWQRAVEQLEEVETQQPQEGLRSKINAVLGGIAAATNRKSQLRAKDNVDTSDSADQTGL